MKGINRGMLIDLFRLCYTFKGWNIAKDGCGENWDFNKTKCQGMM